MNEEGYALLQSKYVAEREKVAKLESLLLRFGSKKYPNGANGCCCLFDDDDNQIQWCAPHADLRDKVVKLEGWLMLLYYHHCDDRETDKTLQELFEYIKAMEPPCPCTIGTPCTYACSCANPVMSGGCDRCDKFKRAMEGSHDSTTKG